MTILLILILIAIIAPGLIRGLFGPLFVLGAAGLFVGVVALGIAAISGAF